MYETLKKISFTPSAARALVPRLRAADIMSPDIITVQQDTPITEVAILMSVEGVGAVPVVDDERRLMGIVTDRDLVVRGLGVERRIDQTEAKDVATSPVVFVDTEDTVSVVLELMGQRQVRRIPVVDKELRVVGLVSMGDIATRSDMDDEMRRAFRRISGNRSAWAPRWP